MRGLSLPMAPDYTDVARRFVVNAPMLSYVAIQMMFWILANNLMGLIIHYHSLLVGSVLSVPIQSDLRSIMALASALGSLYGIVLGTINYRLERVIYKRHLFAKIATAKLIIAASFGMVVFWMLSLISDKLKYHYLLPVAYGSSNKDGLIYSFVMFMLFYMIMSLLIGFINLVNKKYGPGILLPLILGKYTTPIEEERIFMFMDLQSSTTLAEKLGHLNYSSFIRDCFWDINHVLARYNAEIYQYAGDEIIVTWKPKEGFRDNSCIQFFFSCEEQFSRKVDYYWTTYDAAPKFKAGVHVGMITAVEVGDIKREIAYHGDTINTTAHIQSLCNSFNKTLLVSEHLLNRTDLNSHFQVETLGIIPLKGKRAPIAISCVEKVIPTERQN